MHFGLFTFYLYEILHNISMLRGIIAIVSSILGFVTFVTFLYFIKQGKPHKILNFFADISYPLYVTHPAVGYYFSVIMNCKLDIINPFIVFFYSSTLFILLAYFLHRFIERKCILFSKRFS